MSVFNKYKARMDIYNPHDQTLGEQIKESFDDYFNGWRKKVVTAIYNDLSARDLECIIQDINITNRGEMADEKTLITRIGDPMTNGIQIWWRDRMWMVVNREIRSIESHEQAKLREMNAKVPWVIDDKGTVCGNGEGQWVFIENPSTQFALGNTRIANYARFADDNLLMLVQDNVESRVLRINSRLFVNERPYEIIMRNVTSRVGIIEFLLREDFDNVETDDVENQIADIRPQLPREEVDTGSINGPDNIRIGATEKFTIESDNEVGKVIVTDINRAVTIVSQSDNYIELRSIRDYRLLGSTITIHVLYESGQSSTKDIRIIAPN